MHFYKEIINLSLNWKKNSGGLKRCIYSRQRLAKCYKTPGKEKENKSIIKEANTDAIKSNENNKWELKSKKKGKILAEQAFMLNLVMI
jgi:hypothetical protein